jgi:hypothetical protein
MKNRVVILAIMMFVLVSLFIVAGVLNHKNDVRNNFTANDVNNKKNHQCGMSCKQLDDLLDPVYNIKQVIENTLLLEQHLVNDRQYCFDCVTKHFLLCTGLLSEAVWLAGKSCNLYPHLTDDTVFYNEIFNFWLDNRDNKQIRLEIAEKLRQKRKQLVQDYIVNGKELQEKCKQAKQIST